MFRSLFLAAAGLGNKLALTQQRSHDDQPFRIQRLAADGLACSAVPIGGVALIAFLTMQVPSAHNTLWISLTAASGSSTSTNSSLYRSSCKSMTMVFSG